MLQASAERGRHGQGPERLLHARGPEIPSLSFPRVPPRSPATTPDFLDQPQPHSCAEHGASRLPSAGVTGRPVFVLGMTRRSGTNYLWDALATHPDLAVPAPVWEDALVHESHHLSAYIDALEAFYRGRPHWGVQEFMRDELPAVIGGALSGWLAGRLPAGKRLLTKTPSVQNLDSFFTWFPDAYLIVLVRDGAAVAESCVRTFGWTYDQAISQWASAAETILACESRLGADGAGQYRRVRDEELVDDPVAVVTGLLRFVGCDPDAADSNAIATLPVRGSSTFRGESQRVHWNPVPRTSEFQPCSRAAHWAPELWSRYAWLAGTAAGRLGYDVPGGPVGVQPDV
jgi:hypothetical protein